MDWKHGDRCLVRHDDLADSETARLTKLGRPATVVATYPAQGTARVQFDKGRARIPHADVVRLNDLYPA